MPNSLKFALPLLAVLFACDSGDTVVALNLSFLSTGQKTKSVAVSITQSGQSPVDVELDIPMKASDAGQVVDVKDNHFVQRVTLPTGYTDGPVSISAVAKDASGATINMGTTSVDINAPGAVAAYLVVGEDPSKKPTTKADAGADAN